MPLSRDRKAKANNQGPQARVGDHFRKRPRYPVHKVEGASRAWEIRLEDFA